MGETLSKKPILFKKSRTYWHILVYKKGLIVVQERPSDNPQKYNFAQVPALNNVLWGHLKSVCLWLIFWDRVINMYLNWNFCINWRKVYIQSLRAVNKRLCGKGSVLVTPLRDNNLLKILPFVISRTGGNKLILNESIPINIQHSEATSPFYRVGLSLETCRHKSNTLLYSDSNNVSDTRNSKLNRI